MTKLEYITVSFERAVQTFGVLEQVIKLVGEYEIHKNDKKRLKEKEENLKLLNELSVYYTNRLLSAGYRVKNVSPQSTEQNRKEESQPEERSELAST